MQSIGSSIDNFRRLQHADSQGPFPIKVLAMLQSLRQDPSLPLQFRPNVRCWARRASKASIMAAEKIATALAHVAQTPQRVGRLFCCCGLLTVYCKLAPEVALKQASWALQSGSILALGTRSQDCKPPSNTKRMICFCRRPTLRKVAVALAAAGRGRLVLTSPPRSSATACHEMRDVFEELRTPCSSYELVDLLVAPKLAFARPLGAGVPWHTISRPCTA